MRIDEFIALLNSSPEQVEFEQSMQLIDSHYHFTPAEFRNGDLVNGANENNGSCKILAFAKIHNLTEAQALACFGTYYRDEVLKQPDADNHQNIRNFMSTGWRGVEFPEVPVVLSLR